MKQATLSVCMIAKNEEKNIGRCLESVKHIADEMIVVDTGSQDRTMEIARSYGAKVIEDPWQDDFSRARNCSLDAVTKDWVLFLDADEALPYEDAVHLKKLISDPHQPYQAYYFRLQTMVGGENIREAVIMRLFKYDKSYRFVGRIHEQIINDIKEKHGDACTANTDIRVLHYGYDQGEEVNKRKNQRNINILLKCSDEEKHCYYYYVLGNEYLRSDQVDEAIVCYEKSYYDVDYEKYPYMHYPYLIMNLVRMYMEKEYYQKAIALIERVRPSLPAYKDIYFMEMLAYIECGRLYDAKKSLDEYLACPQKQVYEYPCNYFEQSYDIASIKAQLDQKAIRTTPGRLLTVILGEDEEKVIATIRSVHGITHRMLVVGESLSERILGYGAYPLKEPMAIFEAKEKFAWILLVKEGKVFGLDECRQMVTLTEGEEGQCYQLLDNTVNALAPTLFGQLLRYDRTLLEEAIKTL